MNKKHNYTKKSLSYAKNLRHNITEFENKLWLRLKNRGFKNLKFCRQVPIGDYIVDFLCKEKRVIIELDGSGHLEEEQIKHDEKRDKYLKSLGYKILRIYNNELNKIESVLEFIDINI